jgi:hypothetical protein
MTGDDPTTWPCPPWRHMRHVALQESRALRAFAAQGRVAVGLPRPDLLDDYNPRVPWHTLEPGTGDRRCCALCGESIAGMNARARFCSRTCQSRSYYHTSKDDVLTGRRAG